MSPSMEHARAVYGKRNRTTMYVLWETPVIGATLTFELCLGFMPSASFSAPWPSHTARCPCIRW